MAKNSAFLALFAVLVLINRRVRKGFGNSFHIPARLHTQKSIFEKKDV